MKKLISICEGWMKDLRRLLWSTGVWSSSWQFSNNKRMSGTEYTWVLVVVLCLLCCCVSCVVVVLCFLCVVVVLCFLCCCGVGEVLLQCYYGGTFEQLHNNNNLQQPSRMTHEQPIGGLDRSSVYSAAAAPVSSVKTTTIIIK